MFTAYRFFMDKNMKKGFTLFEMLVTIVLLTVGVVTLLSMMSASIFADTNGENAQIALYLAQETMENIKDASSYANIDSYASSRTSLTGDFADFDREVTVSGDPKQVDVIVYWTTGGADQSVDLVSLFADYDY